MATPTSSPAGARLIVGVTAHRDLAPGLVPRLEADVRAWLRRMQTVHPDLPLVVMSALAEGGDRLVARCALDLGIPLIAPLPMTRADFESDFADAASRAEFCALLARAGHACLPLARVATLLLWRLVAGGATAWGAGAAAACAGVKFLLVAAAAGWSLVALVAGWRGRRPVG